MNAGVTGPQRHHDWLLLAIEGVLITVVLATLIGAVVAALPLMGLFSTVGVIVGLVVILLLVVAAALLGRTSDDDLFEPMEQTENA